MYCNQRAYFSRTTGFGTATVFRRRHPANSDLRKSRRRFHHGRAILARDAGWTAGVAGPLRETAAVAASFQSELARWIAFNDPEVIGRSDVAESEQRKLALRGLLKLFRCHQLTDSQLARDQLSLDGLKYDGVEEDLRPILQERGDGLKDVYACAIELAESWDMESLSDELAELVLDTSVPFQTRKDAGYTLQRIGSIEAKHRLRPLVFSADDGDDDREELKGLALRCNWPDNLTEAELLDALNSPRRQSYYGAYEGFLYELAHQEFDAAGTRAKGLRWAESLLKRGHSVSRIDQIATNVVLGVIDSLDDSEVFDRFVQYVMQAEKVGARPFTSEHNDTANVKMSIWRERLAKHETLRRRLLIALVSTNVESHSIWWAARSVPGLLNAADFEWLLNQAVDENLLEDQRKCYAEIASRLPWMNERRLVDAWLKMRKHEMVNSVFGMQLSVELNSELATQMRAVYEAEQNEDIPEPLDPPPAERIQTLIVRSDEDPRWFGELVRVLNLSETSEFYDLERFVLKTPGWAAASPVVKDHILDAAKRLLQSCGELAKCHKIPLNSILGDGVMPAIFLLLEMDRGWLEQRGTDWWTRWSWFILRELHLNLHGEDDEPKRELMRMLAAKVPEAVQKHLLRLARRQGGDRLLSALLPALESTSSSVSDDSFDDALCDLIRHKNISGERLSTVMNIVLKRSPEKGVPVCVARLALTSKSTPTVPAVRAAIALLEECPAEAGDVLLEFFHKRTDLAKHAIMKVAYHERLPHRTMEGLGLGSQRAGQLLDLMFTLFPPEEDPSREGFYSVSEHDEAVRLRSNLLNWLTDRADADADAEAMVALRNLNEKYGVKYQWLRRPLSEARRRSLLAQWVPVPLGTMAEILHCADRRLVRSSQDVIDGIIYALDRYNYRLQHGTPLAVEDLWNNPSGVPASPKIEERVSDKVCEAIHDTFVDYAVVASREVQIRRRVVPKSDGGTSGSLVDVHVESPAAGTASGERLIVLVEVKRSCNPEARTGLQEQLVDRYLAEGEADHGVFVVAYLNAPELKKSHKPKWSTIDEARRELSAQADAVANNTGGTICVKSFVLDARLK